MFFNNFNLLILKNKKNYFDVIKNILKKHYTSLYQT
jgi:hypothetical protein